MNRTTLLYGLSLALHASLGAAVASIPKETRRQSTSVTLKEAPKKKTEAPKPVDPPKPAPEASPVKSSPRAKSAPAEAKPAAAPSPAGAKGGGSDIPDFGLSLGGGGPGGLAIPQGGGGGGDPANKSPVAKKAAPQQPPPKAEDDCVEPIVKPKPQRQVSPAYPEKARGAKIEGKVRVEVTLDDRGVVTGARVASGLGYGLDESALAAARQMTFSPATRCGKPVGHSVVVAIRFVLGS